MARGRRLRGGRGRRAGRTAGRRQAARGRPGRSAVRIACVGECMIELLDLGGGTMRQSFGGDVFNTAAYLARRARQAGTGMDVEFVTFTGDDVYSREMRALWRRHGV